MALCFNIKSSRPNPKVKSWQFPNVHSDSRICSREITKLQYNLMWWKNNWSDPLKSVIGESTICLLANAKRPPLLGIPKNCLKSWDVGEPRKLDNHKSYHQYLQMPLPWLQSCRQKNASSFNIKSSQTSPKIKSSCFPKCAFWFNDLLQGNCQIAV